MECGEIGVILTAVLRVLVVIVVAGIVRILAVLRTIGDHKPNRIAVVVADSSVLQDLAVVACALVIIISVTDADCSWNYYDTGGERVSSLRAPPLTRVKPSAKRDVITTV